MRYYVIAGEASGDLHGSNLLKEIRKMDGQAEFRCWGGDKMEAQGATLVKHFRDLAFMGFAEVLMNLRTILQNIRFCKEDISNYKPDTLILIDYPGFNLRIAAWAKKQGIKVIYYISPQVWAWKENRVKMMRQCIDLMMVILPFEKEYFKNKWNWDVSYVGHPLVQHIDEFRPQVSSFSDKPVVAVLPGSRKQEISVKLPVMLEVSKSFPGYQFIVAMAPGTSEAFYQPFIAAYPNVSCVGGLTYELLKTARAALVTSGTATLEAALFKRPMVIAYNMHPISWWITRRKKLQPWVGLPNILAGEFLVPEFLQDQAQPGLMAVALQAWLTQPDRVKSVQTRFDAMHQDLKRDTARSCADAIEKVLAR